MRILVVEDEDQIRRICERALLEAGYEVHCAESGRSAAPRLNEQWDIVLTDITMPGETDGLQLLRLTRQRGSADVILMTAYPGLNTTLEALREGAYDYLIKPFTVDVLLKTIRRCAERRELSAELAREKALRADLEEAHRRLLEMESIKEMFGRFVTPTIVSLVLGRPRDEWKKGERVVATVLFADIREFTPFAERMTPEEVVQSLDLVMASAIEAVQTEGGIINKFMGDGILAIFGAPISSPDHAVRAARAALRIREDVESMARSRQSLGTTPLHIGIGISTGEMVAGCIGTQERTEFTVIGHAVNMGARLAGKAAPGQILLSPESIPRLGSAFALRPVGFLELAGIKEKLQPAELLAEGKLLPETSP